MLLVVGIEVRERANKTQGAVKAYTTEKVRKL
jgi:Holliday junction resolvase-like predicted endonuclease